MAEVERIWFRNVLNGESGPNRWTRDTGEFADFDIYQADRADAFDAWRSASTEPPVSDQHVALSE